MMAIVVGPPPSLPGIYDYIRILPEIVLSVFGMIVMLLDPLLERRGQRTLGGIALIGAVGALLATLYQAQPRFWGFAFWDMVKIDAFSVFFHFIVAAVTVVVILNSYEYMEVQQIRAAEYYGLLLLGAVGMDLMSSAVELVLIFIALEISSISTYILAGFRRRAAISSESSLKYFLLGSFATAFFLYGVALLFGATGSTSIAAKVFRSLPRRSRTSAAITSTIMRRWRPISKPRCGCSTSFSRRASPPSSGQMIRNRAR